MPSTEDDPVKIEGVFFFDPEDPIYADHFPGNPIVPGSVIIGAFMQAAEKSMAEGRARTVFDFRFRRFVSPGEYPYRISVADGQFKCRLFDGNSVIATGTLAP